MRSMVQLHSFRWVVYQLELMLEYLVESLHWPSAGFPWLAEREKELPGLDCLFVRLGPIPPSKEMGNWDWKTWMWKHDLELLGRKEKASEVHLLPFDQKRDMEKMMDSCWASTSFPCSFVPPMGTGVGREGIGDRCELGTHWNE